MFSPALLACILLATGGAEDIMENSSDTGRVRRGLQPDFSKITFDPNCPAKWKGENPRHTMCMVDVGSDVPMTEAEKIAVLDKHNEIRTLVNPSATDMMKMVWDEDLAEVAGKWSRQCQLKHDSKSRSLPKFPDTWMGQNGGSGPRSVLEVTVSWFNERHDWRYGLGQVTPGKKIGHYTQEVFRNAARIGCGKSDCPADTGVGGSMVVCNYATGQGDFRRPYTAGESCAACRGKCDASGKLCDCQGKVCTNGGTLDLNTCTCKCTSLYTGDICQTQSCPPADDKKCGPMYWHSPDQCEQNSLTREKCPYMCKVCKHNCGDKICQNSGVMDWKTCQCSCTGIFSGDTCQKANCPDKDSINCGADQHYKPENCDWSRNTRKHCPNMCGVCSRDCGGKKCYNLGLLNWSKCECECGLGFTGPTCKECKGTKDHRGCGVYQGWNTSNCKAIYIFNRCPRMCNLC